MVVPDVPACRGRVAARLQKAHVLVVGVGGVGAYAAEMIVRAGVGEITLLDADTVEESNLNRQLVALHSSLSRAKVDVLGERLLDINPCLKLHTCCRYLEARRCRGVARYAL